MLSLKCKLYWKLLYSILGNFNTTVQITHCNNCSCCCYDNIRTKIRLLLASRVISLSSFMDKTFDQQKQGKSWLSIQINTFVVFFCFLCEYFILFYYSSTKCFASEYFSFYWFLFPFQIHLHLLLAMIGLFLFFFFL